MRTRRDAWRPLLYFSLYRCALAAVLMLLVLWDVAPRQEWTPRPLVFRWMVTAYFAFAVLALVAVRHRWAGLDRQVFVQIVLDVVTLTVIMHAAGGLSSGFALLIVIAIAGGSILTQGRIAVLFAAIATLAVLSQQIWTYLFEPGAELQYPHAGLLGMAFFATSFVISALASRLRLSEALVARREVDLANLAQLNDYIIHRMQSGVLALDAQARVRLMNASARSLLGRASWRVGEELAGSTPELAAAYQQWRQQREHSSYVVEPAASGLRLVASFAAIGEDGTVVFLEDAAATNQRAQQLKLASLGRLAASIAHEIRNPLGAISHAGQLLEESSEMDDGDRRLTRIIQENSARMNAMVENILELGRGRNATPETLGLQAWLEHFVEEFTARRPGAGAVISTRVEPSELQVRVDPSQLHQVLWNLCDNALQHAGEPPRVSLEAGLGAYTNRPFLEVTDNGEGIAQEELDRVFEPFFTTRDQARAWGCTSPGSCVRETRRGSAWRTPAAAAASGSHSRIRDAGARRRNERTAGTGGG